jgi:DNA-binding NtrC family response regulator
MTPHVPILLVDDNHAWREALAELLRDQGFEVWTAEGPRSGQEVIDKGQVLAAVIDFRMPEMTGLEWLRTLGDQLPVVMLSSEEDPALAEEVVAEGALAFVSKNLAPRRLLRTLRLLLVLAVVAGLARRVLAGELGRLLPPPDDTRAVA